MSRHTADIVDRYYQTTSCRVGVPDAGYYRRAGLALSRRLGSWLPGKGDAVLDLGCGLGEMCGVALARGAAPVVGVNLCGEEIELARKQVPAEFVKSDITAFLHLEKRRFDWIGCLNILEHLPKDGVVETLSLIRERLKPGGSLVIMTPNAVSPFFAATRYGDFTHELAFTPSSIRQLARLCGFAVQEFRECGPIPHGVVSGLRYAAWQALRWGLALYLLIEGGDRKGGIYTIDLLALLTGGNRTEGNG